VFRIRTLSGNPGNPGFLFESWKLLEKFWNFKVTA
jgi:hypothetical protein